jgi:hypothetical protein
VNIIRQKLKDGKSASLMTPSTLKGMVEGLNGYLRAAISDFVSAHLQLKNTLENRVSLSIAVTLRLAED